jgi:hypothetical protein
MFLESWGIGNNAEYFYASYNDFRNGRSPYVRITDCYGVVILFASLTAIKTLIAVMKLTGSKADKTFAIKAIIAIAATSIYVSVTSGSITNLNNLADDYGKSSTSAEASAWLLINNGMKGLRAMFQLYANNHPLIAKEVIISGGFSIRKMTVRGPQPWSARNNAIAGIVDLTAKGFRGNGIHDWWNSYNGKTFQRLTPTTQASTQVLNLASNITVYFMHQLITKDGPQGFDLVAKVGIN